jgi:single-stranded-DNA-specific exonuclease
MANPILFVVGEGWSTGILGLVASRLKDEFYKPILVMGLNNNQITGSGRSIKEFNMIKALQTIPEFFYKFGGHPQACGFTLASPDKLDDFKTSLLKIVAEEIKNVDLTPQITIDAVLDLDEVNWKLHDLLEKFEPFGQANEEPRYAAYGLTVMSIEPIGKDEKHLRLVVKHNSHVTKKTIGFGLGDTKKFPEDWKNCLQPGDKIDIIFTISVNEWNGNRDLQLSIQDIKKSSL